LSSFLSKANKSKEVKEYNLLNGRNVPKWGANKGRLKIIKSVVVYDNNGNFISEYDSLTNCANILNISISNVADSLKWGSWIFGKYKINYKTENYPLRIDNSNIKMKTQKKAIVYILNSYIIEYDSALEASIDTKVSKTSITRSACYNKLKPIRSGHIFAYKEDYEKLFS